MNSSRPSRALDPDIGFPTTRYRPRRSDHNSLRTIPANGHGFTNLKKFLSCCSDSKIVSTYEIIYVFPSKSPLFCCNTLC
ncbi:unnamed protein product [Allacma fusca]|uniref:Uncharacterized protein n=1 Tax=Allacma fusca TaxID=39272 RepID=A0A8J2P5Z8_9HEXA|nr:unnamed protein product [Allacma fusca]